MDCREKAAEKAAERGKKRDQDEEDQLEGIFSLYILLELGKQMCLKADPRAKKQSWRDIAKTGNDKRLKDYRNAYRMRRKQCKIPHIRMEIMIVGLS